MSKLLFIKNLEELNYIERNLKHLLTSHKIITICSLPWLRLYVQGFSVELVSDYLSGDSLKNIIKETRVILEEWYKPFEQLLNYKGINLGELVIFEQTWFFREVISSYLAFQRIINVHKPNEITIFANLDTPLATSRTKGTNDIFAAVAIWECEIRKISLHKLFLRRKFSKTVSRLRVRLKRKITRYVPLALFFYYYLKRQMHSIIYRSDPRRILLSSFSKVPHKKLAIAFGDNLTLLILKPVMRILSSLKDFNTVFLNRETNFNIAHLKNRSGLDEDNDLKFVALEDFSSLRIFEIIGIISSLQKARRCFELAETESLSSPLCQILKNPNLAVQFDFLWSDYFLEAVPIIDQLSDMYERWKPDIVVTTNMIWHYDRGLVKLASKYGIKSITVPHGWVGGIEEYNFESDLFLAWGEFSRKHLIEEFNKQVENIAVVGAIQFEKLIPSLRQSSSDIIKDIKKKFGLRLDAKVVVVMTSGLPQHVFLAHDMKRFFEVWELMKLFIQRHPEIDFIIRPHPAQQGIEWYRQLIRDFNRPNLKIIEGVKLETFLPAADVGILMDEPTTAGYLFILFGIPLIFFKGYIKSGLFRTIDAWNEDNGVLVAEQENELLDLIERLLNNDNFRKETLKKEEGFLDKSLLVRDGKVGERIAQAVEGLCLDSVTRIK